MRTGAALLLLSLVGGCLSPANLPGDAAARDDLRAAQVMDQSNSPVDMATVADLSGPYPAGPYGATIGDTVTPLVWEGYVNPTADAVSTTKAYGPYSMNDARLSGSKYALIHTAEFL